MEYIAKRLADVPWYGAVLLVVGVLLAFGARAALRRMKLAPEVQERLAMGCKVAGLLCVAAAMLAVMHVF